MTTATVPGAEAQAPVPGSPEYNEAMAAKFRASKNEVETVLTEKFANPDGTAAPTTQAAAASQVATRPDGIPEKFWDAEKGEVRIADLAKSYTELEALRSKPADQQTPPDQAAADQDAQAAVQAAGLDWDALGSKIEASGKLDDADYASLEKVGVPRAIADRYIQLLQGERDHATQEAYRYGGGEEAVTGLLDWAAKTLPKDQIEGYNSMLSSPNWKVALDTLKSLKAQASPTAGEPNLNNPAGLGGAAPAGFATENDMRAAMRDPRYFAKTPEGAAYRAEVEQKVRLAPWRR